MKLLTIMALMLLASCGGGSGVPKTIGGNNTGNGCTIEPVTNLGVNITCDGETVFVPNGAKGEKGDKGDTGSNVFADALAIHTSKRKSVFRLSIYCQFDINGDDVYGDTFSYDGNNVNFYESHRGTGFLIENRKVVTNKHVLSDDACDKEFSDGTKWEGRLYNVVINAISYWNDSLTSLPSDRINIWRSNMDIYHHSTKDLAKITVPQSFVTNRTPFVIESSAADSMLTPTLSMSFPLGIDDMITNIGEIVNDSSVTFDEYDFMTSNDTDGGSSGSPIIDINTGKVIGVLTAGFNEANMNPSIAIHAHRLNDF